MWAYVRRRLVLALLTYWAVATFVFGLLHLTGDPVSVLLAGTPAGRVDVEQMRRDLGFDRPIALQYVRFVARAVRGDLGHSLRSGQPALPLVAERLASTALLATGAMLVAVVFSLPLGLGAAPDMRVGMVSQEGTPSSCLILVMPGFVDPTPMAPR